MANLKTLEQYFALMNFNGAAQVYHTALSMGLLDALDREPLSVAALANVCDVQPYPTELVIKALQSLGLVEPVAESQEEKIERWTPTDLARMLLGGEYRELGNPYWQHLPDFLRTGTPLKAMNAASESETHYQSQAAALAWMLGPAAEYAVKTLGIPDKRHSLAILDIGAGSAIWSLTIARHDPGTSVTAVDWPAVLEVAKHTAQQLGVEQALTTRAGSYHEVELPLESFDLAIVANVTHLESNDANLSLFRRVHKSLKRGGEIAVVDVLPTCPQSELTTSLYQLGLALRTERGRVFPASELASLLERAGFNPPQQIPLKVPPYLVGLLLASKQ